MFVNANNTSHLSSPERGVRLAAQLIETVVDCSLEHAVLQEGVVGSWGTGLVPGVVEGDLYICMLLLPVHKGTQPGCGMRRQPIPATTSAWLKLGPPWQQQLLPTSVVAL